MQICSARRVAATLRLTIIVSIVAIAPSHARADGIEDTAQICASCHGTAGVPADPAIPVIWGQNEGYLYLQLRDIKRGSRKVEVMAPIVERLEKPDFQALAAYFSTRSWPDLGQPTASDADARRALQASGSIGCTGCHSADFKAAGSVPRLAGQQRAYLAKEMLDFRTGARGNNPGMTDLMNAADPSDLESLASYLAGL
jgi:cytochrome c553